ncbi:guanine-1-methyltransferase-domain-containing protein [Spinellus fusiger]|nr:guanine-1-methyltransferase-domain-containing protein [Spinellus fusiger]
MSFTEPTPATEATTTTTIDQLKDYKGLKYDPNDPKFAGLGKNAIKRILRDEIWDSKKQQRLEQQREKTKQRKAERRQLISDGVIEPPPKKQRRPEITLTNVGVVIDCSFSSYMVKKEIQSLQSQLLHCHGSNRGAVLSVPLTVTSFDAPLQQVLDDKVVGWSNWKNIKFETQPYEDLYAKEDLVYLSADSEDVIEELEQGKTYIIGGIVDKNRYKGLCQEKATQQGIKTGRLPIGEYLQMASRKVLTVNHVLEIMLKWLEHRDWEKAFMEVIPMRKLKDSSLVKEKEEKEEEKEKEKEKEEQ